MYVYAVHSKACIQKTHFYVKILFVVNMMELLHRYLMFNTWICVAHTLIGSHCNFTKHNFIFIIIIPIIHKVLKFYPGVKAEEVTQVYDNYAAI